MIPLLSIARNFFLGREPRKGWGPLARFDVAFANRAVVKELAEIGIDVRDPSQAVGTLSGESASAWRSPGPCYFGARVLILDEPTSALGVHQAAIVLKYVAQARNRGLGVVFISHNIHHAYAGGRPVHASQPREEQGNVPAERDHAGRGPACHGGRRGSAARGDGNQPARRTQTGGRLTGRVKGSGWNERSGSGSASSAPASSVRWSIFQTCAGWRSSTRSSALPMHRRTCAGSWRAADYAAHGSYQQLLDAGIDAILVAAPDQYHAEITLNALARGKARVLRKTALLLRCPGRGDRGRAGLRPARSCRSAT